MNTERVLWITNIFLVTGGYQVHQFNTKTRTYELSILALVNFVWLMLCYAICFNQHFEDSALLQLILDVSPFLRKLVSLQLFLGLKIMVVFVYEMKRITAAMRSVARVMLVSPEIDPSMSTKFSRHELVAYALLYMPLCLMFVIILYIAYEMQFKLPPIAHIFVVMALFLPHYILAGSVRYFSIAQWLLQLRMAEVSASLEQVLDTHKENVSGIANIMLPHLQQVISNAKRQLKELAEVQVQLCKTLRVQLLLLFVLNWNCVLAGSYSLLYFWNIWYILFAENVRRAFYAGNTGIYVLILCDLLCIGLVQYFARKKRLHLLSLLSESLQSLACSTWPKHLRSTLKQLIATLRYQFNYGILNIASYRFFMLQSLAIMTIALRVLFSYLNDQFTLLAERLDNDEEN